MKYAVVTNGIVDNVIELDEQTEWTPPEGSSVINIDETPAGPGWAYDGTTFTAPPPIDPDEWQPEPEPNE